MAGTSPLTVKNARKRPGCLARTPHSELLDDVPVLAARARARLETEPVRLAPAREVEDARVWVCEVVERVVRRRWA